MIPTAPTGYLLLRLLSGSLAGLFAASTAAQAQALFKSPDEAASALVTAARSGDFSQLYPVLGIAAREVLTSGDKVLDTANRQRFVAAYDARHGIVQKDGKATLFVGQEEFPFPIPMVQSKDRWKFDIQAGRSEVIARRIGRNELDAIQAGLAILDAQQEYASQNRDGRGSGAYAQRIVSKPGTKDGLYWPTAPGEPASPLGELAAEAAADGYVAGQDRQPFHGYYFKLLRKQGPAAPGGAMDYVAGGRMFGGFAILAYPAEYARSGITSFILSHAGTVYERDLGPGTRRIASRMDSFNPEPGWEKVATNRSP